MAESQHQQHPPRRVAMDPPHITEFASERYFEKLNQLHASRQHAESADSGASTTMTTTTTLTTTATVTANAQAPSRFILPLREAKVPDVDAVKPHDSKQNRRFFGGIRQKVALKHIRSDADSTAVAIPIRASTDSTRKRLVMMKQPETSEEKAGGLEAIRIPLRLVRHFQ